MHGNLTVTPGYELSHTFLHIFAGILISLFHSAFFILLHIFRLPIPLKGHFHSPVLSSRVWAYLYCFRVPMSHLIMERLSCIGRISQLALIIPLKFIILFHVC